MDISSRVMIASCALLLWPLSSVAQSEIKSVGDVEKCGFAGLVMQEGFKRTSAVEVNRGSFYCEFTSDSTKVVTFIAQDLGSCDNSAESCAKRYLRTQGAKRWGKSKIDSRSIAGHAFYCFTSSKAGNVVEKCALYFEGGRVYLEASWANLGYADQVVADIFVSL